MAGIWKHIALLVSLVLAYAALTESTWRGSTELHTITEVIGAILALIVGLVAIVRFYAKKNNMYLFVGTGFIGTALLDSYHAVVTSSFFDQLLPSAPSSLIPWSWNASRTFLALLMALSYWAWKREQRLKAAGGIGEGAVYIGVSVLTLISFYFFAFVPLPRAYYPELFFGRPEEFVSATLFLMALIGYLEKGIWRQDPFENPLVVSLLIGFTGQALFMSRSFGLFDAMFDAAHLLKVASYAVMLEGLLKNTYALFVQAERSSAELSRVNDDLLEELSARREAENALARSNAELEQFAYIASHDLQEPVRSLVSYSTLLREDLGEGLSEDAATDLDYIAKAANRMQTLITDLLAFSRAGRAAMKTEIVSLDECVDESLEALRSHLQQSGARIECQALPRVVGDATLLTQLYQNLLSNALKFARDGEPEVELTVPQTGDVWTLGVRDNGIGLKLEYAEQIFEPFKRLHGLTEYPGTGIGLAICRKIVEHHGGRIWVESRPAEDAHFKFTLPNAGKELEQS